MFDMHDRSTVPIVLQPSKPRKEVPLPGEEYFSSRKRRSSSKIKMLSPDKIKPETILVDPYHLLYTKYMCIAGVGVADVKANEPFQILVAVTTKCLYYQIKW